MTAPTQRPRKLTINSGKTSLSSSKTPTATTPSSRKDYKKKEAKAVPIWLSVFIGRPDQGRFDHARFSARVSEEAWSPKARLISINKSPSDSPREKPLPTLQSQHLRYPEIRLPVLYAAGKVCVAFTKEILTVHDGRCVICRKDRARFTMCRPVAVTRAGYFDLPDEARMYRFMATVASHTAHFTKRREVDWSIGAFFSDRPYMCCIAVPVCSTEDSCFRSALSCMQSYVLGVLDGRVKARPLKDMLIKRVQKPQPPSSPWLGRSFSSNAVTNSVVSPGAPVSSFGPIGNPNNVDRKLFTIGTTVFIGRPELQIGNRGQHRQLSCLVLSSTWPENFLPGHAKNEADEAYDYCRVTGSHERHILETAEYRCAICPEVVPARSLLHRPILVNRTGRRSLQNNTLRGCLTQLAQYVKSNWNYRELELFFGADSDGHIWDFAVPICETKTICEEVARTAAREFIKLFLPPDMPLFFSGLDPDTDLSLLEFDDDSDDDDNDNTHTNNYDKNSHREQESPELWVKKIAPRALMTARGDRGEDPFDCALTVAKLRHWYELCFKEEVAKREYLRQIGYKRTGDISDSDSDEESEIDDSVVWVYARDDAAQGTGNASAGSQAQNQLQQSVLQRLDNQVLFPPALSFDFWLLCEAVGGSRRAEEDSDSDATITLAGV